MALEDALDARVLLGCVSDAGSRVHQWLEIWVQNVANVLAAPPAARDSLSNAALDKRWQETSSALESLAPADTFQTGWEAEPAPPTWIDPKSAKPMHPVDEATHKRWACAGTNRLWQRRGSHRTRRRCIDTFTFQNIPRNRRLWQSRRTRLPLIAYSRSNRFFLAVRTSCRLRLGDCCGCARLSPLTLEELADLLGGKPSGAMATRVPREFVPRLTMDDAGVDGDGWLFMGRHGRWGRVIESLHLRLRAG